MSLQKRVRRKRIIFSLIAVVFALVALEIVAKALVGDERVGHVSPAGRYEIFIADADLFWSLRPGSTREREDIRINELGFRGGEIGPKQSGTARIVCLGDSVTFGFKVKEWDAYPSRLQRLLEKHFEIEVINSGVPGHSSLQGLRRFERDVLPLNPDVVIVSYGNNDVLDAPYSDKDHPPVTPSLQRLNRLARRSALARLVAGQKTEGELVTRCLPEDSQANLHAIAEAAVKNGVDVFFFHPPRALAPAMALPHFEVPEDLPIIDVPGAFAAELPRSLTMFQGDLSHPTPTGYGVLARAIAQSLTESGVLKGYAKAD